MNSPLSDKNTPFQFAIESAGLGWFEYNHSTETITINNRLAKWLGIDQLTSIPFESFLSAFKQSGKIKNSILSVAKDSSSSFEIVVETTHKPTIALEIKGSAFDDENSLTVTGIVEAAGTRITVESENYKELIDAIPAIVWITDPNGYCTYLNQNWYDFTGQQAKEAEGFGWLDAISPEDRPLAEREFVSTNKKRQPYYVVVRIRHHSGEYRWCIDQGLPKFSEDGEYEGMIGTVIDVHKEKVSTEITRMREQQLQSVVDSAPFPIGVYIGQELRIQIANKSMIDAWGKGDDVIGRFYTDILPELGNQKIFEQLRDVLRTGEAFHAKNTLVDIVINDVLKPHYFNYSFTPLFDADGNVYGVMNTAAEVTELNVAQKKSAQNERKFASLVATAPIAIGVFMGRDLIIETHNSSFVNIVGKGPDIEAKPLREVMPELLSEGQPFLKILDEVYTTGVPYESYGEQVKIVQNGIMTNNYYDISYTPMHDEHGEIYAILDIAIDVTDNVLAQRKIQESEKSLRNTILKAPVAMCIFRSPEFTIEIANDRMLDFWGRTSEVIGQPLFDALPEAKNQGYEELLSQVYYKGETVNMFENPVSLMRNDGLELIYVDFVYEPLRDADDHITGIIAIAREVTQQVVARKKIEEAEERARLAIESADLGVYEVDLPTNEIKTSNRFKEIWGIDREFSRPSLIDLVHPDDMEKRANSYKKALKSGNLEYEARIVRPNGDQVWFRAKGKFLKDTNGNPTTLIGVVQDITEQKEFAEQLKRLVQQKTVELQKTNEDLQQFAHVASHDLKEPVRKIKFYSNMLQDQFASLLPEKGQSHLDKIHNATDRMFSMIDGVLKYSATRAIDQDIEQISLSEVFDNIESDLEVIIAQKQAVLIREGLPTIEGAPVLIYQLFYNIVNNAMKFSSQTEQPVVEVSADIVSENGKEFVKITLSDNGIGLDPNYISKIFNPFTRLNPKDKYEGTGLGLTLCKKIAEQHSGTIDATGTPGKGAIFTVMLPQKQKGKVLTSHH